MATLDEKIKKDIVDTMYWDDRVDATDIHVDVFDGAVELRGTVSHFSARMAAETDAWYIPQVNAVKNEIEVKHSDGHQVPEDEEIRSHIIELFVWNPNIDASTIEVSVDKGVVILTGSVDAYWKKQACQELSFVKGVRNIINKLLVVPVKSFEDRAIAEHLVAAINRNPLINIISLKVGVKKGKVILEGQVSNRNSFRFAEETVKHMSGIIEVDNQLTMTEGTQS